MAKGKQKSMFGLIALDIEGDWNVPLLENAAELSDASLTYAASGTNADLAAEHCISFDDAVGGYNTVIACETGKRAQNIFHYHAPRGKVALVVGNEHTGIPKKILKQCDATVVIPMHCSQLSSVNVAASSATGLYTLSRDLARQGLPRQNGKQHYPDLLLYAPEDPSECGSSLRSAAAFGWKQVYLHDPEHIWFTDDQRMVAPSRAAARREVNPVVVLESEHISAKNYSKVIKCTGDRTSVPLSKYRPESFHGALLTYGKEVLPEQLEALPQEEVYVDFLNHRIEPKPRHTLTTLLAVLSWHIRGDRK